MNLNDSKNLGRHFLVDFLFCNVQVINNMEKIRTHLLKAANLAQATVIKDTFHKFSPQGISGVIVIAESHLAIHTWPEHECVALDLFTCSEKMEAQKAIDYLENVFEAKKTLVQVVLRCQNYCPEAIDTPPEG